MICFEYLHRYVGAVNPSAMSKQRSLYSDAQNYHKILCITVEYVYAGAFHSLILPIFYLVIHIYLVFLLIIKATRIGLQRL